MLVLSKMWPIFVKICQYLSNIHQYLPISVNMCQYIFVQYLSSTCYQVLATKHSVATALDQVLGTWYLAPSIWYHVLGTKYLVPCAGYQISGIKYLAPRTWYQVKLRKLYIILNRIKQNSQTNMHASSTFYGMFGIFPGG